MTFSLRQNRPYIEPHIDGIGKINPKSVFNHKPGHDPVQCLRLKLSSSPCSTCSTVRFCVTHYLNLTLNLAWTYSTKSLHPYLTTSSPPLGLSSCKQASGLSEDNSPSFV
ncbi:uncharacterized protein V6R79_022686 [Siganus canaliculatus]